MRSPGSPAKMDNLSTSSARADVRTYIRGRKQKRLQAAQSSPITSSILARNDKMDLLDEIVPTGRKRARSQSGDRSVKRSRNKVDKNQSPSMLASQMSDTRPPLQEKSTDSKTRQHPTDFVALSLLPRISSPKPHVSNVRRSSAKLKENNITAHADHLASPFRPSPASRANNSTQSNHRSRFSVFSRRSSAGALSPKKSMDAAFLRRPSGSPTLNKKKPAFEALSPYIPTRKIKENATALTPSPSFAFHSMNFALGNGTMPFVTSTPLKTLKTAERRNKLLLELTTADAPDSPMMENAPCFQQDHSALILGSPARQVVRPSRKVRMPDDSIFTNSLELSISLTMKQPITRAEDLERDSDPRVSVQKDIGAQDDPSATAHKQTEGWLTDIMSLDPGDISSDDVLDLFQYMDIQENDTTLTQDVYSASLRNSRGKASKKVIKRGRGVRAELLRPRIGSPIPFNDDDSDDELLLTSKGWDWDPRVT